MSACQQVEELIPWVVNGTAATGEQAEVHLHIATCPTCRGALVQCLALQRRVQRLVHALPASVERALGAWGCAPEPRASHSVLERTLALLPAMEALGLSPLVGATLRRAVDAGRRPIALRIGVPFARPVTLYA